MRKYEMRNGKNGNEFNRKNGEKIDRQQQIKIVNLEFSEIFVK